LKFCQGSRTGIGRPKRRRVHRPSSFLLHIGRRRNRRQSNLERKWIVEYRPAAGHTTEN
jgi:hypothetical protein